MEYLFDDLIRIKFRTDKIWEYSGSDSEELCKKLSRNPKWMGHNYRCEYRYNSFGYRCPEFKDIDRDYALAFGCSHTEGTGLQESDSWPSILCRKLGYPVYNLGVAGASNQFTFFNNILWIKNYRKFNANARLPKTVYIQWTQITRHGEVNNRGTYDTCAPNYPNGTLPVWTAMLNENVMNFELNTWYYYQTLKLLWQSLGVQQIHFSIEPWEINQDYQHVLRDCDWHWINDGTFKVDLARDERHFGPKTMLNVVNRLEDIRSAARSWIRHSE